VFSRIGNFDLLVICAVIEKEKTKDGLLNLLVGGLDT
jgi:hypothetical protein